MCATPTIESCRPFATRRTSTLSDTAVVLQSPSQYAVANNRDKPFQRHRRMRRFIGGSSGPKQLILPITSKSSSFSVSASAFAPPLPADLEDEPTPRPRRPQSAILFSSFARGSGSSVLGNSNTIGGGSGDSFYKRASLQSTVSVSSAWDELERVFGSDVPDVTPPAARRADEPDSEGAGDAELFGLVAAAAATAGATDSAERPRLARSQSLFAELTEAARQEEDEEEDDEEVEAGGGEGIEEEVAATYYNERVGGSESSGAYGDGDVNDDFGAHGDATAVEEEEEEEEEEELSPKTPVPTRATELLPFTRSPSPSPSLSPPPPPPPPLSSPPSSPPSSSPPRAAHRDNNCAPAYIGRLVRPAASPLGYGCRRGFACRAAGRIARLCCAPLCLARRMLVQGLLHVAAPLAKAAVELVWLLVGFVLRSTGARSSSCSRGGSSGGNGGSRGSGERSRSGSSSVAGANGRSAAPPAEVMLVPLGSLGDGTAATATASATATNAATDNAKDANTAATVTTVYAAHGKGDENGTNVTNDKHTPESTASEEEVCATNTLCSFPSLPASFSSVSSSLSSSTYCCCCAFPSSSSPPPSSPSPPVVIAAAVSHETTRLLFGTTRRMLGELLGVLGIRLPRPFLAVFSPPTPLPPPPSSSPPSSPPPPRSSSSSSAPTSSEDQRVRTGDRHMRNQDQDRDQSQQQQQQAPQYHDHGQQQQQQQQQLSWRKYHHHHHYCCYQHRCLAGGGRRLLLPFVPLAHCVECAGQYQQQQKSLQQQQQQQQQQQLSAQHFRCWLRHSVGLALAVVSHLRGRAAGAGEQWCCANGTVAAATDVELRGGGDCDDGGDGAVADTVADTADATPTVATPAAA